MFTKVTLQPIICLRLIIININYNLLTDYLIVEDEAMRRYILDKTAAPYFSNIVWYIRDQCTTLDSLLKTAT